MFRIIGIDPGVTTGYVEFLADKESFQVVYTTEIAWTARFGILRLLAGMDISDQDAPLLPEAIVIEAFKLFAHKAESQIGSDFPSAQFIGLCEAYAELLGVRDKIVFQPASIKARVDVPSSISTSGHIRDAYAHARYWHVTQVQYGKCNPQVGYHLRSEVRNLINGVYNV